MGEVHMTTPKIQALGITQEGAPTRWKVTDYVDGVGWLEAWGTSLMEAMEALQVLAAERVASATVVAEAYEVIEEDETPLCRRTL
jgi:hypothetical protein